LSSGELLELKLGGSGSDLLLIGVTLLAFNKQLACHLNEIRTGNCPASWSLLSWVRRQDRFFGAFSVRAVLSAGCCSGTRCLETMSMQSGEGSGCHWKKTCI